MDPKLWLFSALLSIAYSQTNVTLTTKKGLIIGLRFDPNPATNVSYDAFIGIQYGNVTARFLNAVPPDIWTTPKVTQTDGAACPQLGMDYNEQCLYLNVFTPKNASGTPGTLPVMVFVHGSAFLYGSSSSAFYGPDFLVPSGVILVTMNYRLGAVGFLTLGSKVAPGNQGLQDTTLALQWIQDEISVFGGDPKQVTLFGQSAGGFMTQWHYLSPMTTGLFVRGIAESGSGLAEQRGVFPPEEGARRAKLLAKALNCSTTAADAVILACLQAADIQDVVANQMIPLDYKFTVSALAVPFVATLDTMEISDTPFFNDSLANLMPQALARGKPLINGFNSDEGIFMFAASSGWKEAEDNLQYFMPGSATYLASLSDAQINESARQVRSQYFPDTIDENKIEGLIQLYTDFIFAYDSIKMSRYFANLTYSYSFSYVGSWSPPASSISKYKLTGVSHADELNYLFYHTGGVQYLDSCPSNLPNLEISDKMVNWWTSFAKTGVPEGWNTTSDAGYLVIDSTLSYMNVSSMESLRYDIWATLENLKATSASSSNSVSCLFVLLSTFYVCLKTL